MHCLQLAKLATKSLAGLGFLLLLTSAPNCIAGDEPPTNTSTLLMQRALAAEAAEKPVDAILLLQQVLAQDPGQEEAIAALIRLTGSDDMAPTTTNNAESLFFPFSARGSIAVDFGHDDNINSITTVEKIQIPRFNGLSVSVKNPLLTSTPSSFTGLVGNLEVTYSYSPQTRIFVKGFANLRFHSAQIAYFPHSYRLEGALQRSFGLTDATLGISREWHWLLRYRGMERNTFFMDYRLPISSALAMSLRGERRETSYPYFSRETARGRFLQTSIEHPSSGLALSLFGGQEKANEAAPELERRVEGLSVGWTKNWGSHRFTGLANAESSQYADISPLFLVKRRDRNRIMMLEYDYSFGGSYAGWHLAPRLIQEKNDSNIALSSYSRRQIMLEARREF